MNLEIYRKFESLGIVSVKDSPYYASGDGTTDDTTVIQSIIDDNPGKVIYFPSGTYLISNITINEPVVLTGDAVAETPASTYSQAGTSFKAKSGSTGALFTVVRGSVYRNYETYLPGVQFRNVMIDGNARGVDVSAFDLSYADHLVMENVYIQHVKYSAIVFNTSVRESWFSRVHTRYCGSIADDKPCIDMRELSNADAHNNIKFNDCLLIYSLGTTCEIDKYSGSSTVPRNISFENCMVHGLVSAVDNLPYTLTAGQKTLTHLLLGDCGAINSINTRWFVGGDAAPTIHMQSTATDAILTVVGGEVSNHYASTGQYDGIKVEDGTLMVDGVYFTGNNQPIDQTGGNVFVSPSTIFTGNAANPLYSANTISARAPIYIPGFGYSGLPSATLYADGTMYYATDVDMPLVSDGTNWRLIPRVGVGSNVGDNSKTLVVADEPTQHWNTALTADKTCTLPANSASVPGMKYRIIRRASATGAFNLTIQDATPTTLKVLATAGEWCDVEYVSGAWLLTAYGAL